MMSLMRSMPLAVAVFVTLLFAMAAFSQTQQYRVGDKIEVLNLSYEWVPAKITGIDTWNGKLVYHVELDDKNAPNVILNYTPPDHIRPRGGARQQQPTRGGNTTNTSTNNSGDGGLGSIGSMGNMGSIFKNDPPRDGGQAKTAGGGTPTGLANAEVGTPVDGYYDKTHGKMRGVIMDGDGNKVKIHYRGCAPNWDEWVDRSQAHVPNTISAGDPAITFLFARWRLTKVGISSYNVAWGSAEGIEISPGGTYTWYQGKGQPPVRGKWQTDAKVPGTDNGTPFYDGVLVKDAEGQDWKVYKWSVKGYPDGIQVQRMCSGESIVGSRAK